LRGRDYLAPHLPPTVGVRGRDATPVTQRRGVAEPEVCGDALSHTLAVGDAPAQPEMYYDAPLAELSVTATGVVSPSSSWAALGLWRAGGPLVLQGLRRLLIDGSGGGLGTGPRTD